MTSSVPCCVCILAALAPLALGGCHRAPESSLASATTAAAATFALPAAARGDALCDQAVDNAGQWLAYTTSPPGDGNAAGPLMRPLILMPLGAALQGQDANVVVAVDVEAGGAQIGAWRWSRLVFSADGGTLALPAPAQLVEVSQTPRLVPLAGSTPCYAYALAFSGDGTQLAAACGSGKFQVWQVGAPGAAPLEVALAPASLSAQTMTAATLAAVDAGAWRLVVAGDHIAPQVYDIAASAVTVTDLATAGLAGSGLRAIADPRLALNPAAADLFFVAGGSGGSFALQLLLAAQPFSIAGAPNVPQDAQAAQAVQIGPDGLHAMAAVSFTAAAVATTTFTQLVVWEVSGGGLVLRTSDSTAAFSGNAMTLAGKIYGWQGTATAQAPTVGVWQL